LRYATLVSSRHFRDHRDGGDGRSLAVRPIRGANLGAAIAGAEAADEFSQLHLGATTLHTSGRLAHALAPITQEPQSAAAHGSRQKAEATEQEARRFTLAGSS